MGRERVGFDLKETASRTNYPEDDLILFESGLLDPQDYRDGLLEDLANAYGSTDLLEIHENLFGPIKRRKEES